MSINLIEITQLNGLLLFLSANFISLTGCTKRKSGTKKGSKAERKLDDEVDSGTNHEVNGDASGIQYDEAYSETETDGRLVGEMIHNLYEVVVCFPTLKVLE